LQSIYEGNEVMPRVSPIPLALALAGLLMGSFATRASTADNLVDRYVRNEMAKRHIPGVALAVISHGRVEKTATYGFANAEFSVPVRLDTRFPIASITKEFTSVGLMMLVESGQVKLDDQIGSYLDNLPPSWREVSIRRLLNHTSGLPDVIDAASEALADIAGDAINLLRDKPLAFAPGSRWSYNQTNYMLLQMLIEKVSGRHFGQFCEERLFAPLKLGSPQFGFQVIRNRASLYTSVVVGSDPPIVLEHIEPYSPSKPAAMLDSAGGLNISIEDFSRWLIAVLDGKLISKDSLDELWTPAKLNDGTSVNMYGLGWWLALQSPHPAVGGNGGGRAAFFVYRKDELAVIVLTNLIGSDPPSMVAGIAEKYLGTLP
jgi:CubicO group peptidase (beta-lactamase class C family)